MSEHERSGRWLARLAPWLVAAPTGAVCGLFGIPFTAWWTLIALSSFFAIDGPLDPFRGVFAFGLAVIPAGLAALGYLLVRRRSAAAWKIATTLSFGALGSIVLATMTVMTSIP